MVSDLKEISAITADRVQTHRSYCQFFDKISKTRAFFLSLLSYAIFFTLYMVFVVLGIVLAVKIL